MSQELQRVEQELQALRQRVTELEQRLDSQAKQMQDLKPGLARPPVRQENAGWNGPTAFVTLQPTKTKPPQGKRKASSFSEEKLAGTWFNRLGVVAILLALAFFLKWSFDNNLVGNLGRIVIGMVLGLGFLAAGELFQRKDFRVYGQGFTGGGIGILYFSVFAAFSFYHLISQPVSFGLMVLITLAASLLAVRDDSMSVGILGIVGGFATPFLLSDGSSNLLVLFTYVAILDAGVFTVSYHKNWYLFNYLTFLFTYLTFVVWYGTDHGPGTMWFALAFLTLFFLVYLGVSFVRNIRLKEKTNPFDLTLIFANAAAYFALDYLLLAQDYHAYMGFVSAILGLIYILIGNFTYKSNGEDPNLSLTFLGVAAGFITLAIPLQLGDLWIAAAWGIEAAVLLWLSFRYGSFKARLAGLVVLGFSVLYLLASPFRISGDEFLILLNNAALAHLAVIALMGAILFIFSREKLEERDRRLYTGLQIAANLLVIIFLTREIEAYYSYLNWLGFSRTPGVYRSSDARDLTLSIAWGLYAGMLIAIGFRRKLKALRLFSLGFLVLVILKVFIFDLASLSTPFRILSFVVLGVILLTISWLYQRYKQYIFGEVNRDERLDI